MKTYKISVSLLLFLGAETLYAQDTYTNFTMTNTCDVIGTAKYVGMGGAMGALGADISSISLNPASIGLFKRYDVSMTMGGIIQNATPAACDSRSRYSFDQIGFVLAFQDDFGGVNFGMNLQKKMDATYSLAAGYNGLNGLSQAAQLAGLGANCLNSVAYDALLFDIGPDPNSAGQPTTNIDEYVNTKAYANDFWKYSTGEIYGLDINLSGNVQNRVFWGVGMGVDFLRYKYDAQYIEYRDGYTRSGALSKYAIQDYDISSNKYVSGTGLNVKLGVIFRPIENNPFRIGLAVETPTWYALSQRASYYSIASKWECTGTIPANTAATAGTGSSASDIYTYTYLPLGKYATHNSVDENYLSFNVYTPWRFRVALATTLGTNFAADVEYEYAMYNYLKMGYPTNYSYGGGASLSMHKDAAMTTLTKNTLKGIHNIRAGVEYKPFKSFCIRAGYNYFTKAMKEGARMDMSIDSDVINYMGNTDFINYGDTHIATVGVGYRGKVFYADVSYKFRYQHGDFYAFDDMFQTQYTPEAQFCYGGDALQATDVDLSKHTISVTIGARF